MSKVQRPLGKRLTAWLLVCALLLGLAPAVELGGAASAAYADSYMQQMVDWGFMRGDIEGNLRPDDPITRAEFVTIVNRSFGYEAMEGHPFDDVDVRDWYNDDVDISYTEGYISGTSEHTFSPGDSITREEAAVILARNLMLQPAVGEDTSFSDSRELDEWSRGYVATAARYQLLNGYEDGSFRPKNPITRGEAAILMTRAIGTPVQEAGVHELGSTWGNVTITESGVTLRNTVVGGNLYITAGVELGSVTLENVRVLGEIIVSGGGLSEGGDDSIVFRNVDAPKLIVDNLRNQQVSLRVEGNGIIDNTSVRTDAFVTDNTQAGYGLSRIELDGEADELSLHLSGNGKEVVNKTPGSALSVDSGRVESITVDESATDSTLHIAAGAEVESVYLDVGTEVTGEGDIGHLTVNAPGSSVSMLPDQITIRPGIEADIDGETMDSAAAAESSADPRLLSGYPSVTDLAPTTATAQFSANKRGTVHWAVTSVTDGSATVDELLNPPAYTNKIVQNGTLSLGGSGEVGTAALRNLTSDGSYYLAAVFVDAREEQSPLKVVSFTTPDNSVPAFADGYPYLSQVTNISAQVTGMATKTCRLYWAVLPAGAAAPTAEDFKANAVSGNLGFGTLDVTKNVEFTFDANNVPLEELEDYVVYLWLNDVDGGQSSRVESLDFTTVDRTPPIFNTEATVNDVQRNSVGLYANLNEDGTLYWVVVAHGEEYPKPLAGQSGEVDLSSDTAKLQVANGMNALRSGSVRMTEGRDVSFTVSGLDPETAYDLYYVAQDTAGNYSDRVRMIEIHSLDPNAPTVTQEFTRYPGTDATQPYPDTDIRLVFSEAVQDSNANKALVSYYTDVVNAGANDTAAREAMATALRNSIKLYQNTGNGRPTEVAEAPADAAEKAAADWVIDYRYAQITLEEGKTVVTFPTTNDRTSALNLASGATYYFEIQADTIADTSDAKNIMGRTQLEEFTTVFAIVNLSNPNITDLGLYKEGDKVNDGDPGLTEDQAAEKNRVDVSWTLTPMSTESTASNVDWDMIIWTDTSINYELYYREVGSQAEWELLGSESVLVGNEEWSGRSLTRHFKDISSNPDFDPLNSLKEDSEYQYAVHFTQVGTLTDPATWSQRIQIRINVVAGTTNSLSELANSPKIETYDALIQSGDVSSIGQPDDYTLVKQFSDQTPPEFANGRPTFQTGSSAVNMSLMLDRTGTVYYLLAPVGTVTTIGTKEGSTTETIFTKDNYTDLPNFGEFNGEQFLYDYTFRQPDRLDIVEPEGNTNTDIKYGVLENVGTMERPELVEGLRPNTPYIVYFVIQGQSNQAYSQVYAYWFATTDVDIPYITLEATNPEVSFETSQDAQLDYALFAPNQLPDIFDEPLEGEYVDSTVPGDVPGDNDTGRAISILDAMLQTYDRTTGESYFDHFAAQPIKDDIQYIIQRRSTGGGSPVTTGSLDTLMEAAQSVDFTSAMQSEQNATYFYCLATAQHALGSEYSFKAVENVHIPDLEPPYLTIVSRTLDLTKCDPEENRYTGTLTLQFNEPIYFMDYQTNSTLGDRNTLRPIYQIPYGNVPNDPSSGQGYISIIAAAGSPTGFSVTNWLQTPTRTFTINFTNIGDGATFTLSNIGVLSDASMNSTSEAFTVRFVVGDGGVEGFLSTAQFEVISGDYRPVGGN